VAIFTFKMTNPSCWAVLPPLDLGHKERAQFTNAKKNFCLTEFDLDTVKMLMNIFVSLPHLFRIKYPNTSHPRVCGVAGECRSHI
jgi:hypothetical protein